MSIENQIRTECGKVADILVEKNKAYGNSACCPLKVFSKLNAEERIKVRLDDKLSRIANGHEYKDEDTELDIIGYLILKRVRDNIAKEMTGKVTFYDELRDGE